MPGPRFCLQIARLRAKNYAVYSAMRISGDPGTVLTAPMPVHFSPPLPLAAHPVLRYLWRCLEWDGLVVSPMPHAQL